jgi:S1/P1 Nuclease
VSAIVNQTSRVNDQSLSPAQQGFALRFLLHFIGDIHQPLHTEAEATGGNDIKVQFDNDHSINLHAVWDTAILEKHAGNGDEINDAKTWADTLFNNDNTGSIAAECQDITSAEQCALLWAREANAHVCSYVLKDGVEGVQGVNLGDGYYDGAVPIVDDLILKAGKRLGAWINALAAQAGSLDLDLVDQSMRRELKRNLEKRPKKGHFICPDPDA